MKIKYLSQNINNEIILKIYDTTKFLEKQYPNYNYWFEKIKNEIDGTNREVIYVEIESEIIGLIILKNTKEEKKICTLFVKEKYRNKGIGNILLGKGFDFLQTSIPLITIPENKVYLFERIIKKYNWKYSKTTYIYNTPEKVFNI